jgi:cytosine/adenosine deaminase-related metal-dependent hydrolase
MCEGVMSDVTELNLIASAHGLDAAPTPHSCYTMSPQLLSSSASAGLKDGFLSYHSQESYEEEELLISGSGAMYDNRVRNNMSTPPVTGESSLKYFIERLEDAAPAPYDQHILLVHNVCLKQDDIDAAKKVMNNVFWAVCPLSNIFIHNTLPPIKLMVDNDLAITLGTDSLSSNDDLSMVKEIECLHKNFPEIPMNDIFKWASLNGARFLSKDGELGSFAKGKKPGIVLVTGIDQNGGVTTSSTTRRII